MVADHTGDTAAAGDAADPTPPAAEHADPGHAVADRVETPAGDAADHTQAEEPPAMTAGADDAVLDEPVARAGPDDTPEVADEPSALVVAETAADPVTEEAPAEAAVEDLPAEPAPPPEDPKKWYVVKVQSGREETIKKDIERKVKIRSLEEFYGQIAVPVEEYYEKKKVSVKDKKTGQRVTEERNVTKRRKKFPGYIFAHVEYNENILYLFRETSGVGDFVGATHTRAPNPMPDREVQQMLTGVIDPKDKNRKVKVKLDFEKGDKVRIRDGAFAGSEAEVKEISEPKDPTDIPKVKLVVTIWGRPVEMEMESLQVDKV